MTTPIPVLWRLTSGHRLRGVGFANDIREGAPRCRWALGNLTVDILPTRGELQGFNTVWFQEALESAVEIEVSGARLKVVSPVGFLATKHAAYLDRGQGDFYGSANLEDFVTRSIAALSADPDFQDALSGLLASDEAGQARLPGLRFKLKQIADS